MKECSNCRHYKRCTAASRQVVCNCYEEYGYRKEDEKIMNTEKVLVLLFAEPNGEKTQLRGTWEMIDKIEAEYFIKKESGLLHKDLLGGRIKMIYSGGDNKPNLKHSDSGEVFNGSIIFVALNEKKEPVNITNKQIAAIKAVYKKVEV